MHFLSREIIFHVRCRWWCLLRAFRRNKGHEFQPIAQAWHRNEALKSAFWFGSSSYRLHRYIRLHRYRCHIGTRLRYPTLVIIQICVLINHINIHTHAHRHTHAHTHTHLKTDGWSANCVWMFSAFFHTSSRVPQLKSTAQVHLLECLTPAINDFFWSYLSSEHLAMARIL